MVMNLFVQGQVYTFTNATATGNVGPTQANVNAAYSGTTLDAAVTAIGGIQYWIVPASGNYSIEGFGGQGYGSFGGRGAHIYGEFALIAGDTLKILVGQQAGDYLNFPAVTFDKQFGGGGGSFITQMDNTPLVVAGGGGGNHGTSFVPSCDGQITTAGASGSGALLSGLGAGGTAGGGGFEGLTSGDGGGGLLGDGIGAGAQGLAFVNGGLGGIDEGTGGFGCGGGTSSFNNFRGGGGGGYSGGGGSNGGTICCPAGGGGGSFNSGTNPTDLAGVQLGHGSVVISSLCAATIAPTMSCPANITASNDVGVCGATVTYTVPVGIDDCGSSNAILTSGLASGATFPIGITTNTYTFTNTITTVTCSFTVTVADTQAPITACPQNLIFNTDSGMCDAVVTYTTPIALDNCSGGTTALTSGLASGSTFPIGVSTVTYTATDSAGNIGIPCSFTVTVVDTEIPGLTCPDSLITCDSIVMGIAPTTNDNCAGEFVTYTLSGATTGTGITDASGETFNIGITNVMYQVTDSAGNTDSCSFYVQVDNCVGIDENNTLNSINIYPNPTNGLVTVNLGNHNGSINYSISTIEGRIVNQESNVTTNRMTINLSNESKGVYLLKIEDQTSSKVYKIIRK